MFTLLVAERNTPCTSILLAGERGPHCTSVLLVVERNTPCIKTLDPDWIRVGIQPKMLDPKPYQMTTDLKHWSILLVVKSNTPSTSILLAGERCLVLHSSYSWQKVVVVKVIRSAHPWAPAAGLFLLYDVENSHLNAGMPDKSLTSALLP